MKSDILKPFRRAIALSASDSAMIVSLGYHGLHCPTPAEAKAANAARVQPKEKPDVQK